MSSFQAIVGGYAGAALTSSQYLWVYPDGTDSEKFKVLTDDTYYSNGVGVLQNAPADDGAASVSVGGLCTAKAGGTIEPFDWVTNDSAGKTVAWTAGTIKRGIYLPEKPGSAAATKQDAASNQEIRILVLPAGATSGGIIAGSATLDFGSIAVGDDAELTSAVTGVETGDIVLISAPSLEDNLVATGYASAADQITVRVSNIGQPSVLCATKSAHDFGTVNTLAAATTTVTVTGAVADSPVALSIESSDVGMSYNAYVSAADTVTVEAHNVDDTNANIDTTATDIHVAVFANGTAINPASQTFYYAVIKQ